VISLAGEIEKYILHLAVLCWGVSSCI